MKKNWKNVLLYIVRIIELLITASNLMFYKCFLLFPLSNKSVLHS